MRFDVETLRVHVLDLVLGLRDDDRHVGLVHVLDRGLKLPLIISQGVAHPSREIVSVFRPVLADSVVHPSVARNICRLSVQQLRDSPGIL